MTLIWIQHTKILIKSKLESKLVHQEDGQYWPWCSLKSFSSTFVHTNLCIYCFIALSTVLFALLHSLYMYCFIAFSTVLFALLHSLYMYTANYQLSKDLKIYLSLSLSEINDKRRRSKKSNRCLPPRRETSVQPPAWTLYGRQAIWGAITSQFPYQNEIILGNQNKSHNRSIV